MLLLTPKPFKVETLSDKQFIVKNDVIFSLDNYKEYLTKLNVTIKKIDSLSKEEYIIEILENGIVISYTDDSGLFYAAITLDQLNYNYKHNIPCVKIQDKPNYEYRGFMLDVGRYYFKTSDIKTLIDLCAYHKLNKFHLHLTEDQGFRIEIKKYPLLTEKGSKRSHTNFNVKPHSGFYTQEELKNIVKYCQDRFMEVIPELDIPGHSQAAISAYKELGCFDRKLPVATHWGVKHDILCAGKEYTYEFYENVLNEIMDIFPSKYIHLGGDEAVKTRWKICPNCQAKMKELGLKDENELQAYFINRMADVVIKRNRIPVTWNEYDISNMANKNIAWQIWCVDENSTNILNAIKNDNRKIIYSSSVDTYIDLPTSKVSMDKCYDTKLATLMNREQVEGIETTLWSEFVPNLKVAERQTLPRLTALAEAMWSINKDKKEFFDNLSTYKKFYISKGYKIPKDSYTFPSKPRSLLKDIWFERRQLTWHGLHNLIDNAHVKRKYGKNN